jgi:hypothetical protein
MTSFLLTNNILQNVKILCFGQNHLKCQKQQKTPKIKNPGGS